jgi:proline iminopeptidase
LTQEKVRPDRVVRRATSTMGRRFETMPISMSRRQALASAAALALLPASGAAAQEPAPATPIQGRLIPVRDTRLWVEDYGPKDAPALLYVHGGPGLGVFEFSHFMRERLSRNHRLILVDQRGVLRSDPLAAGEPMTLSVLSADYDAVRQALAIPRWSILGHSWGGPVALHYAVTHEGTVDRVIFENTVLDADSTGRNMLSHAADALDAAGKRRDATAVRRLVRTADTQALWDRMDASLNRLPSRQSLYVYDPKYLGFYGRISTGSGIPDERWAQGMKMALMLLKDPEAMAPAWNRISRLSQPTLLLRGQTDPSISPREIAALTGKPNAHLIEVPRSGHFIHVEQPDALAAEVDRFLAA